MSDNGDLTLSVRAQTDQASFAAAAKAAAGVGEAFGKTFAQVERSNSLAAAAKDFAQIAIAENDAAKAAIELNESLKAMGASDKEIDKTVRAFERQLLAINKADEAAAKRAANDAQRAAQSIERDETAARAENDRRDKSSSTGGAAPDEYSEASKQFSSAGDVESNLNALSGIIGAIGGPAAQQATQSLAEIFGAIEGLGRLPAAVKGLPDAVGGFAKTFGLAKAATDAAKTAEAAKTAVDVASTATTATATAAETAQAAASGALAVSSGAAAAGIGAMLIPLLPFVAAAIAAAAAVAGLVAIVAALQAQSNEANEALKKQYEAQDEIDAFIRSGATLEEAYKKQADIQGVITDAMTRRNEAEEAYAKDFERRSQGIFGQLGARIEDLFNLNGSTDDAFNARIAETEKVAKDAAPGLEELNKRIADGGFAANDRAKAEKEATEATEQAEKKRLADIESTNARLEDLSRGHQEKLIDLATAAAQKLEDVDQGNKDKIADARQKASDDARNAIRAAGLAEQQAKLDAIEAQADAVQTAQQAEIDAAKDANRKLEDLHTKAIDDETSATDDRNFLLAAKQNEALKKAEDAAKLEADRAAEDRKTNFDREIAELNEEEGEKAAERARNFRNEQDQRAQAQRDQARNDATAYQRSLRDAEQAAERAEQQELTSYERADNQLVAHLTELEGIQQGHYERVIDMAAGASQAIGETLSRVASAAASAGINYAPIVHTPLNTSGINNGSFITGSFGGLRPIPTQGARNNSTSNIVSIYANSSNDVLEALERLKII